MKNTLSEVKVGVTVLLAMLILVISILWGKQVRLTTNAYQVEVVFPDIVGLEKGAAVLVNGVRKGRVKDFNLQQDGVVVTLSLDANVTLYEDARFEVTSPELMGGKVVNIFPGTSGRALQPGVIFQGETGSGMNKLMNMASDLVVDVQRLLNVLESTIENINKTAGDPRLREAFLSSINNLDESTAHTLELITLNEGKLNQVMDNLVSTTDEIRRLTETHSADIDQAINDFNQFTALLNQLTGRLDQVVRKLQSEEGSLGMLINDDQLATMLMQTIADLDSLTQQIRREGVKTHITLFGRRKK